MARRIATRGTCNLCNRDFAKGAMTRHMRSCRNKTADASQGPSSKSFHVIVEGRYYKDYWMHLAVPVDARLRDLDHFLRETWLECCGHLSAFVFGEVEYYSIPLETFDLDMSPRIDRLLDVGAQFGHEYDFGTMTELSLRVVAEDDMPGQGIRVLARNLPPVLACGVCGESATVVCVDWTDEDERFMCAACAAKEDFEEDMLLPVVNSPRVGECAYTG